jgi:hypothetical protein
MRVDVLGIFSSDRGSTPRTSTTLEAGVQGMVRLRCLFHSSFIAFDRGREVQSTEKLALGHRIKS